MLLLYYYYYSYYFYYYYCATKLLTTPSVLTLHLQVTYIRIETALSAIEGGKAAASPVVRALLGGEGGRAVEGLVPQPAEPMPLEACSRVVWSTNGHFLY